MRLLLTSIWLLLVISINSVFAWDTEQLEVFDVVEEVNQNFYELLGVPQNASLQDVKKAFRRLSLVLHPDKNDAEDAEVQFRNLAAVYDVLKDPKKREHYDNVLINGLPNWRSGVYYYRYVRKMGLLETSITLLIIITIGQYLCSWAAYLEKRYTYKEVLGSKLQKLQKKNRKTKMDVPDLADILEKIPTPSMWNTLPFQLPKWMYTSIVGIPSAIRSIHRILEERKQRKKQEEEEALKAQEEEEEPEPIPRGPRRRRQGFTPQERSEQPIRENYNKKPNETLSNHVMEKQKVGGGLWTDDDILELIKLVKKFPGGIPDRWEKIADTMNRTVAEVTHMAKKVKDEGLKPNQPTEEVPVDEAPKKVKTRAEVTDNITEWSQDQQKALEGALLKYPKTGSSDRWEKIASCIEGKTKEECQARYRYLVEVNKSQEKSEEESRENSHDKPQEKSGEESQEDSRKTEEEEEAKPRPISADGHVAVFPTCDKHKVPIPKRTPREKYLITSITLMVVSYYFWMFTGTWLAFNDTFDKYATYLNLTRSVHVFIIDMGSEGSRISYFEFHVHALTDNLVFDQGAYTEATPGLSTFFDDSEKVVESLNRLVTQARDTLPKELWRSTPIWLRTSEGLTLMPLEKAHIILDECSRVLNNSGFMVDDDSVDVIRGSDKAIYSWLTINMLIRAFTNRPFTVAAFDLDGFSNNVAFAVDSKTIDPRYGKKLYHVSAYNRNFTVYADSFLTMGMFVARKRILTHRDNNRNNKVPYANVTTIHLKSECISPSIPEIVWNFRKKTLIVKPLIDDRHATDRIIKCLEIVRKVVKKVIPYPLPIHPTQRVYAFSNYFDRLQEVKYLQLSKGARVTVGHIQNLAAKACEQPDLMHPFMCLDLSFIYVLLHDGFGLHLTKQIIVTNYIEGQNLDWALGAAYKVLQNRMK
ncbi:uncharacterized protein LOC131667783 [Phymastichus coffea]|uniref:uncharacterized protein LOC131667783 n=1 Tax=Phymastichus coffea TaxID=108790 RepID=UPI00273CDCAF|nr:uncharacterized protein LOC131667783 [Phymastichus coffea]